VGQHVWVATLPPTSRQPLIDRLDRNWPLAQVGLAEYHGTGLTELADDEGILLRPRPQQGREPAVVCIRSPVSMLSFRRIGIPWSGPRAPFALRSTSRAWAIAGASGSSR